MKKIKKTIKIVFVFALILMTVVANGNISVTTESKKVFSNSNSEVSDRELALLASLVYEDVPNSKNYSNSKYNDDSCLFSSDGKIVKTCHFTAHEGSDDKVKRNGKKVFQYIEGMSERKMNLFSKVTLSNQEDGQKYYFYNFADANKEAGEWEIVNYGAGVAKTKSVSLEGKFDAITFKKGDKAKGNNYVIAYRGTDYPDVLEWLQNLQYAVTGEHAQAQAAYDYAQSEYARITEADSDAKIYITGHSLGAYLAQIGGAAIVELGEKKDMDYSKDMDESQIPISDRYDYSASKNLVNVTYFNGMGVSGIGVSKDKVIGYKNALIALARTNASGNVANSGAGVNYNTDLKSSGRLILYSMDGDPISGLGFHYGEIRKLTPAADAISNHKGNHSIIKRKTNKATTLVLNNISKMNKGTSVSAFNNDINDYQIFNTSILKNGKLSSAYKKLRNSVISNLKKAANSLGKSLNKSGIVKSAIRLAPSNIKSVKNRDLIKQDLFIDFDLNNFISGLERMDSEYNVSNLVETLNIAHETDSFLCLTDGKEGVPVLTGGTYNIESTEQDGITKVYTNDKKLFTLVASVKDGCARKYTWYKTDKDGNVIEQITTDKNGYNNYLAIPKNRKVGNNTTEYYKVVVTYGNSYKEQSLVKDGDSYNYELSNNATALDSEGSVSHMYEVNYDTEAPKCSFDPSSISVKKGTTQNVAFSCTDNGGDVSVKLSKLQSLDRYYFSHDSTCSGNTCVTSISAKKRLFTVTRTLTYITKVEDKAGNKDIITSKLKIKTTK